MEISEWLSRSENALKLSGIQTARLDTIILLEHVTGRDRAWLLANQDVVIAPEKLQALTFLLNKRKTHIPINYILGRCEFYGRRFLLKDTVLDPRPESEAMIDLLKSLYDTRTNREQNIDSSHPDVAYAGPAWRIGDVGTGSGALGITAALEIPTGRVDLIDIDKHALEVAKNNVDLFTLQLNVMQSDLLSDTPKDYDILLCNLPYVPDNFQINTAALHEPREAIFGGPDGMDLYRRLFAQINKCQDKPLYILCESMPPQHALLRSIAEGEGYTLHLTEDFIQVFVRTGSE